MNIYRPVPAAIELIAEWSDSVRLMDRSTGRMLDLRTALLLSGTLQTIRWAMCMGLGPESTRCD
jgi:hypothetical protein